MQITTIQQHGNCVALLYSDEILIRDVPSALDIMAAVKYETGCDRFAVNKKAVCEDFFKLSNCIAGEILQRFTNYHVKFAIYGDFSGYTSKPLHDFIYESNNGKDIFFTQTKEDAVERLSRV